MSDLMAEFANTMLTICVLVIPWIVVSAIAYTLAGEVVGFFTFAFGWLLTVPWAALLWHIEREHGVYIVP